MAPVRRYLRITKYSVLECRIYLENPALAQSWLLNPRNPVLPRVIESVRPLVLPKLREEKERERSRKKSKKRSIKDVVTEDDFEVSIFLTETDTRHSLLAKHKHFRDKTQTKLRSNSTRLTGATSDTPIDVDGDLAKDLDVPILRREESDESEAVILEDIPAVGERELEQELGHEVTNGSQHPKRRRRGAQAPSDGDLIWNDDASDHGSEPTEDDSDGGASDAGPDVLGLGRPPPAKRRRGMGMSDLEMERDDKKKLAMDISYEGFAIYGRVLCLVVKRRGGMRGSASSGHAGVRSQAGQPGGQAVMENWITSTQMLPAAVADEMEAP